MVRAQRSTVTSALNAGARDALVVMARQLARDLDATTTTTERLQLTRALRGVLKDVEALDLNQRREARLTRPKPSTAPTEAPSDGLDELLAARKRRHARRGA